MLKKHMAACLVATAFAAAPAFAQTSTTPSTDRPAATGSGSAVTGSSAMQPAQPMQPAGPSSSSNSSATTGASTPNSSSMAQGGMAPGQFMTAMQGNQMLASKLIGTTVVSANNESIGDVNDVVVDANGQVTAVVIGVGGFLGIGEKDVAVPYSSLQFASREQMNAMNNQKSAPAAASGTTAPTAGTNGNVNATGSTGSVMGGNGAPDRIVLSMTKDQLKAAPGFQASPRSGQNAAGGTTAAPAGAAKP